MNRQAKVLTAVILMMVLLVGVVGIASASGITKTDNKFMDFVKRCNETQAKYTKFINTNNVTCQDKSMDRAKYLKDLTAYSKKFNALEKEGKKLKKPPHFKNTYAAQMNVLKITKKMIAIQLKIAKTVDPDNVKPDDITDLVNLKSEMESYQEAYHSLAVITKMEMKEAFED